MAPTRKSWTDADMLAAVEAVKSGRMSYRKAAQHFNVPQSTMSDRCTGRIIHGTRSGPGTILTVDEEKKLAAHFIKCGKQGYGKRKETIMYMATSIARKRKKVLKGHSLSNRWWNGFIRRHPEIQKRDSKNVGLTIKSLVSASTIHSFYKELLEAMTLNGESVLTRPDLIFICNESEFDFDAINKIVATSRGVKHVTRVSNSQHKKVTVLTCTSAIGNNIAPLFIFKNSSGRVPSTVREDAPIGTMFAAQKSDVLDKDIYQNWFKDVFLKSLPDDRPVLCIVDGHKAHITAELIEKAKGTKVAIFCLPGTASHLLKPFDLSVSGKLKKGWIKACANSVAVNQRNFSKIFNSAWRSRMTPDVIANGFKKTGIYPFNPAIFNYSILAKSATPSSTSVQEESVEEAVEEEFVQEPAEEESIQEAAEEEYVQEPAEEESIQEPAEEESVQDPAEEESVQEPSEEDFDQEPAE